MHLSDGHITIRDLRSADEDAYVDILSDPLVSGTLRGTLRPGGPLQLLSKCSREELREKFRHTRMQVISGKPCYYAVEDCGTDRFIGSAGSYPIDDNRVGLSYWIASRLHGRGIGSRILRLYCPVALRYFGRKCMIANVALDNPASKAAVLKAGFIPSRFSDDPGFGSVDGRELFEYAEKTAIPQ